MIRIALALLAQVAAPAAAVGLGPLGIDGVTDNDRKGFRLQLINPYPRALRFSVSGIGWDDDTPADRVTVLPATAAVPANGRRQILVIATGLAPGEIHRFRVCGELAASPSEGMLRARVCSKLVARRLP